jgi:hypothetical protein
MDNISDEAGDAPYGMLRIIINMQERSLAAPARERELFNDA